MDEFSVIQFIVYELIRNLSIDYFLRYTYIGYIGFNNTLSSHIKAYRGQNIF